MNMSKFVIQKNLMNQDSFDKISTSLCVNNIPHSFVDIIPFSHEIICDELLEGTNYLPYGSTSLTMLTHELGWTGNYFHPHSFRYEVWNSVRDDMLNSNVLPISSAIDFLKNQKPKSMWFTRPSEDLKQYSGMVIEAEECWKWFEDAMLCESSGSYQLSRDTMVILSEPKNIVAEWRWFVVNSRVISGSMYRRNGQLDKRKELDNSVIAEAQKIADVWLPHRNCVMDLCLVDGEVKVVEFNTINSSGFYDHDIDKIILALWNDFKE